MPTEVEVEAILRRMSESQKDKLILYLAGWFSIAEPFKFVQNSDWQINPKKAFEKAFEGAINGTK